MPSLGIEYTQDAKQTHFTGLPSAADVAHRNSLRDWNHMDSEVGPQEAERARTSEIRLYSPSWIDRFTDWVDRLPLPNWAFYLAVWLLLFAAETLIHWVDGSYPLGVIYSFHLVLTGTIPYTLALMHYLDKSAESALLRFRPALDVTAAEYAELRYQLTTLPQRPTIIASLIGVGIAALALSLAPESWSRPAVFVSSSFSVGFNIVLTVLMWWLVGAFAYHTAHQLRLVSRIYARHTRINLFRLIPLYAFSDLSARTTIGFLLALYAWYAVLPDTFDRPGNVISAVVANVIAGLIFVWPLLGIHGLLADEKERLLAESAQRLEAAIADLHARMDSGKLDGIENLIKGMEGLEINHNAVSRISTWPWAAETPRGLVAALLFPLMVWLGQWLLQRILGS
jgi:hypothetical protein